MSDRVKNLVLAVQAGISVSPKTFLTDVRAINKAVAQNLNARNYGVYCEFAGDRHRVYQARSQKGVLQLRIGGGVWVESPEQVWVEG